MATPSRKWLRLSAFGASLWLKKKGILEPSPDGWLYESTDLGWDKGSAASVWGQEAGAAAWVLADWGSEAEYLSAFLIPPILLALLKCTVFWEAFLGHLGWEKAPTVLSLAPVCVLSSILPWLMYLCPVFIYAAHLSPQLCKGRGCINLILG